MTAVGVKDPGLCAGCRHARTVEGARTRFWLCSLAATDLRFPRYPALPVLRCAGFEPYREPPASRPPAPLPRLSENR